MITQSYSETVNVQNRITSSSEVVDVGIQSLEGLLLSVWFDPENIPALNRFERFLHHAEAANVNRIILAVLTMIDRPDPVRPRQRKS
jgi:hypothetical protein